MIRYLGSIDSFYDEAVRFNLPLIIIFNRNMWEVSNLEYVVSVIIGGNYINETEENKWISRVERARIEKLFRIGDNQYIDIIDENSGKVKLNYYDDKEDLDYENIEELNNAPKKHIDVSDDKKFTLSMARIGTIMLLERNNSNFFEKEEDKNNTYELCGEKYIKIM
ncbi:MAG: hypothetical protein FWC68_01075 [Oscillospiraceae bacterium]|nr:hypothetical protein [Oscillospiraceae bacterium]